MARIIGTLGSIALILSAVSCANEPTSPPASDRGPAPVVVAVQPAEAVLAAGAGLQLRVGVTGLDDTPLGSAAVDIQWTTSDESVVGVSPSGFVQARRLGTAMVTATVTAPCGTHFGYVPVRVIPLAGTDVTGPAGAQQ